MKSELPEEWVMRRIESEGKALRLYFSVDQLDWESRAIDCWRGELNGLENFRCSRAASVSRWTDEKVGSAFFVKRLTSRGPIDWLKHLFRLSRGMRALLEGARLESDGFKAPRAVCLVELPSRGSVTESMLVTEDIGDAFNIYDWFHEVRGTLKQKRHLIAAYGTEVGRMHARGIFHGDMRKSNVLCRVDDAGYVFYWLDNERNRKYPEIPFIKRIKNLTQVNMEREGVTLTDRMRFWKAYALAAGVAADDARRIQRGVIAKTQKRWKSNH